MRFALPLAATLLLTAAMPAMAEVVMLDAPITDDNVQQAFVLTPGTVLIQLADGMYYQVPTTVAVQVCETADEVWTREDFPGTLEVVCVVELEDNAELVRTQAVARSGGSGGNDAPVAETPVAETPVVEEPAVEEPAVEEPVIEEPVVGEPVVDVPVGEVPAEGEPVPDEAVPGDDGTVVDGDTPVVDGNAPVTEPDTDGDAPAPEAPAPDAGTDADADAGTGTGTDSGTDADADAGIDSDAGGDDAPAQD